MKLTDAVEEIKRIAKRSDYAGDLSSGALKECAEVYLANCDEDGTPRPRVYMHSGEKRKFTNLSEFLWILVRTPSFRKWFGKSVVVDENGDPKVMYHGSWNAFKEFKTSAIKMSKVEMTLWSGPGFYFTDQEKIAKIYAGGKNDTVYAEFLRLENPLVVDETGNAANGKGVSKGEAERIFLDGDNTQWLDSGICNELVRMDAEEGAKGRGKQYYKGLSRQERVSQYVARLKTDVVALKTASKAYGAKSQAKLLASICRHTKHDGVIHTVTPDIKEWVVYDPKSIKSATANNGEFSPDKAKVEDSVEFTGGNERMNIGEKLEGLRNIVAPYFAMLGNNDDMCRAIQEHHVKIRNMSKPELEAGMEKMRAQLTQALTEEENANVAALAVAAMNFLEYCEAFNDIPDMLLANSIHKASQSINGEPDKVTEDKGGHNMIFDSLIDALKNLGGNDKEEAMDIVDHNGRHHQPKAIPEGGQFEEEGKYAATSAAKEDWFHKTFAENKKPEMKKMRDICAEVLSHIDSSKLGNDTAVSDYKQAIHKYADMTKKSVIDGMKKSWSDMKTHADTYKEIKDMGKDEFAGWLKNHPEYNSTQMQNLMENKAYAKTYKIKNAAGEYEDQDHAAWEEAKMMIGRKAVASLVDYMAHTEALHNTPDELIESFLKGKGKGEKHKLGYEDYDKTHGIKHGEGEHAKNVTMSEINAVESEMSKAIEDSKTAPEKTAYFHALSHFLGKDGGMRDPEATKESILQKAAKRMIEKQTAFEEAKNKGESELYKDALNDFDATQEAVKILAKAMSVSDDELKKIYNGVKNPEVATTEAPKDAVETEPTKGIGNNVPSEHVDNGGEPKQIGEGENKPEEKKALTDAGKKLHESIGSFLDSDNGKKFVAMADKVLDQEEKDMLDKTFGDASIAKRLETAESFKKGASKLMKEGKKDDARNQFAKYIHLIKGLHQYLGGIA